MVTPVHLPKLELTMEGATVVRWAVAVGDAIAVEQILVDVETQKSTSEVVSPVAGFVRRILVAEGETVANDGVLCLVTSSADEPLPATPGDAGVTDATPAADPTVQAPPEAGEDGRGAVRAAPAARAEARRLKIDLGRVQGTGPSGRITIDDVRKFAAVSTDISEAGWQEMTAHRLALVAQMSRAVAEIPQITISRRIDVTPLAAPRQDGVTFTHALIFRIAQVLASHPLLRTSTDGRRLRPRPVSVAVAMDTAAGLTAPVLRAADLQSADSISKRLGELKERASRRALAADDLADAPFAVTNLGMHGVDFFTPLVFHGQTSVLAVGRAVEGGSGRRFAWFSLAVDHRVVDGAVAARFLEALQEAILG